MTSWCLHPPHHVTQYGFQFGVVMRRGELTSVDY